MAARIEIWLDTRIKPAQPPSSTHWTKNRGIVVTSWETTIRPDERATWRTSGSFIRSGIIAWGQREIDRWFSQQ